MPDNPAPSQTEQPQDIGYQLQKRVPTLLLAALTAFGTSWCQSERTQEHIQFRLTAVELKATTNADNITKNAEESRKTQDRMIEVLKDQAFILQQIQELKAGQQELMKPRRQN